MAYYLILKKKNIDITSLNEFKKLSKFKSGYSLEEIDEFTSKFNNEVELKKVLYENGLIELDDITEEISIRIKRKDKLEKVKYGLVYSGIKKYLDYDYLRSTICVLQNDKVFLEKLVSNYCNSYSNVVTINKINNYLNLSNIVNFNFDMYSTLNEFIIREIYNKPDENGELKLKYKSLHDLAMFVFNYVSNKERNKLGISYNMEKITKERELLNLQKDILNSKSNVKKKELKKNQIEGQISFFD